MEPTTLCRNPATTLLSPLSTISETVSKHMQPDDLFPPCKQCSPPPPCCNYDWAEIQFSLSCSKHRADKVQVGDGGKWKLLSSSQSQGKYNVSSKLIQILDVLRIFHSPPGLKAFFQLLFVRLLFPTDILVQLQRSMKKEKKCELDKCITTQVHSQLVLCVPGFSSRF